MAASLPGISPPKLRSLVEIMLSTPRARLGHQCKARFAGNGRILTKKCNAAVVGLGRPNVNIISTRLISHRLSGPLQIMAEHKLSDQVWVTKTLTQIPPPRPPPHSVLHGEGGDAVRYTGNYLPASLPYAWRHWQARLRHDGFCRQRGLDSRYLLKD
jgi:hypothetical protein